MQIKNDLRRQFYHVSKIDDRDYPPIVYERLKKIESYDVLMTEGAEEKTILRTLETSRASIYRWRKNYKEEGLIGLENISRKPRNTRKPTWTEEQKNRVLKLRKEFVFWGKSKIAVMYKDRYGSKISVSMVGRILRYLYKRGDIKSVRFMVGQREIKRREFNGHAQPWHPTMKAKKPGELIQIDHMSPRHYTGRQYKHFRAICPVTKISFGHVYYEATSKNATHFLRYILTKFPFPIISAQVDGGSEFMGEFEALFKELKIPLYVLPPRSPEDNGCVERSNSTLKSEFYSQYEGPPTLEAVQQGLEDYSKFYNSIRPHQALDYSTPFRYYKSYTQKEALQSHMY